MGAGTPVGDVVVRGRVFNRSDATVLCWVQDDDTPEIFMLGPNRMSPPDRDVDLVKGWTTGTPDTFTQPVFLNGSDEWFKFGDAGAAVIDGKGTNLSLNVGFNAQVVAVWDQTTFAQKFKFKSGVWGASDGALGSTMSDDDALHEGGLSDDATIDEFTKGDNDWGNSLS